MAAVFANLPVPAANGSGAAVDVRDMSGKKTITVGGAFVGPTLTVEFSLDNANWFPVASFSKPDDKDVELAACWMRVTVAGYLAGMPLAANVDVGAQDGVARAVQIVSPAGAGSGAAADTHLLGTLNTIVVSGVFTGAVHIEISEDNTAWLPLTSFSGQISKTLEFSAQYMRVRREGLVAGTPTVYVAAIDDDDASTAIQGYYETFIDEDSDFDIYVDGVNGDDQNDGLTEATALQTIQAVYRKFPFDTMQGQRVRVYLAGVGGFGANATDTLSYDLVTLRLTGENLPWNNAFSFIGPEMVPVTPTTGPATAVADNPPAVAVAGGSASAGGTLSVRFDFTGAAPGWTAHDFRRYFLRVTRAGVKVTWELPIADNDADQIWCRVPGIAPLFLNTDTYEIVKPAVEFTETQVVASYGYNAIIGHGGLAFKPVAVPEETGAHFQRCAFYVGSVMNNALATFDRCDLGGDGPYIHDCVCQFFNCTAGAIYAYSLASPPWGPYPNETTAADPIPANRLYGINLQLASDFVTFWMGIDGLRLQNGGVYVVDLGLAIDGTGTFNGLAPILIYGNAVLAMEQRPDYSDCAIQGAVDINGPAISCQKGGQARLFGNDRSYAGAVSLWGTLGGNPLDLPESGLSCDYGTGVGDWEEAAGYDGVFYGPPSAGSRGDPVSNITAY